MHLSALRCLALAALFYLPLIASATPYGSFDPQPHSPEARVLTHYRRSGVDPGLLLSFVPTKVQRQLRAAESDKRPAGLGVTDNTWEALRTATRLGGFSGRDEGNWVVEDPRLAEPMLAKMQTIGRTMLGKRRFRTFAAAHELGHATLRAIADSGRLQRELPDAIPALHVDDVFAETFSDLLAIGVLADLKGEAPGKSAARLSRFRRESSRVAPEAAAMAEVADLLAAYPAFVAREGAPPKGVDGQIGPILRFLAGSGVFDSMLIGPAGWQRIHDEGCFDCFPRRPVTPPAGTTERR